MGGASSLWYSQEKRKVLIMNYEYDYMQRLSNCLLKKDIKINESIGFSFDKIEYNDLEFSLWFLTAKNRHLWRHHYFGAQGVILVFSFQDQKKGEVYLYEALNIFTDAILSQIPILILFDSSTKINENLNETFRTKLNSIDHKLVNIQHIDFQNNLSEIKYGLDWLSEVMKPI